MRTRNALERLVVAGRPVLAGLDSLVDMPEEERILAQIVASDRSAARRRRPIALALVAVGLIAIAATSAWISMERGSTPAAKTGRHHHIALTGARIQLAGYHFETPAGFEAGSGSTCWYAASARPGVPSGSLAEAAAADGGCLEAFFMLDTGQYAISPDAQPIDVAGAQGFLVTGSDSLRLYVPLPKAGVDNAYLMLVGQNLTADELVAIAESGLPGPS
jgi:hypothetical protein